MKALLSYLSMVNVNYVVESTICVLKYSYFRRLKTRFFFGS